MCSRRIGMGKMSSSRRIRSKRLHVKYELKDKPKSILMQKKGVTGREVLLAYPDFNSPFEIHTDASKLQIGVVIPRKWQANHFLFTKY